MNPVQPNPEAKTRIDLSEVFGFKKGTNSNGEKGPTKLKHRSSPNEQPPSYAKYEIVHPASKPNMSSPNLQETNPLGEFLSPRLLNFGDILKS